VTLNYDVPVGSRYYLVVAGAPNQYYGNSEVYSALPYTLHLDRTPAGSAQASVTASVFDSDELSFSVPYSQFDMGSAPSSATVLDPSLTGTSEMTGAEFVFERAQLRDHDYQPLIDTLTNYSTSYMQRIVGSLGTSVDYLNRNILTGHVHIKPGFAARYPGVGTVYLEIFGRNHLGHVVSMGVSNSLNLSASGVKAVAYNNLIRHEGDKAVINYSVSATGTVTIKVYTQAGSLVKSITAAANCGSTGCTGSSDWDGTNSNGAKAASGIYFVKVKGPGLDKIVKVAVVR